jgi:hypothetical protein
MTERFMVDDCGTLIDMHTRDTFDYVSDVCGLLNKLSEENTMLKERRHEDINELSVIAMKYKALEKENGRLRRCINEIYTIARLEEV